MDLGTFCASYTNIFDFVREYLVKDQIDFWHFKANKVKMKLSWHFVSKIVQALLPRKLVNKH